MENSATMSVALPPISLKKRGKMSVVSKLLLILFSLFLMAILRTGFLFIVIGLLPSIVVYFIDRSLPQYTFKTVFACNLSAMMPSIVDMLVAGPNSTVLQGIMSNGLNWFAIYSAAIGGMMLIQIMPVVARNVIATLHQTQITRLNQNQQRIEKEWGNEVTQFSNPEGIAHITDLSKPQ